MEDWDSIINFAGYKGAVHYSILKNQQLTNMARGARVKSSKGIYHVMMRGINRQNIFIDDTDKAKFVDFLKSAISHDINLSGKPSGKFKIYAYALMGNHFHLLVKVESGELGEFVKKISSGYVRYFNNRHKRDGHLFKERFKSEPCETFDYFCVLIGYVHQNPIKHGFAKSLDDYPFTSWAEYSGQVCHLPRVCSVDDVLAKMSLDKIKDCIIDMLPDNLKCLDIDKKKGQISDVSILTYLREKYDITNPLSVRDLEKADRKSLIADLLDFGGRVRQISRITGLDAMTVSRIKALQSILLSNTIANI